MNSACVLVPPFVAGETAADYVVEVNGRPVPVHTIVADEPRPSRFAHGVEYAAAGRLLGPQPGQPYYYFASFAFEGTVHVTVKSPLPLDRVIIDPVSAGVRPEIEGAIMSFTLDRPVKLSIAPSGREKALCLFADAPEAGAPQQGDSGVIWLGPGVHRVPGNLLRLASGQTLYLAPGAILRAAVTAEDAEDVAIRGRGIIDGGDWCYKAASGEWPRDEAKLPPAQGLIRFTRCKGVTVRDVVLRESFCWTVVPLDCRQVLVDNIKIVNSRFCGSDDGINPCNSSDVIIRDSFLRTDDDCIAIKGMRDGTTAGCPRPAAQDILVEHCILQCDRARIVLLGHESQAQTMSRITVRDCEIIGCGKKIFVFEPGERMPLTDVAFERIRVVVDAPEVELANIRPTVNQYMVLQEPGRIAGVRFEDIAVENAVPARIIAAGWAANHRTPATDTVTGLARIVVAGWDADHAVDGLVIKNVRLSKGRVALEAGPFVRGVKFEID